MRRTTARLAVLLVSGLLGGLLSPGFGAGQTADTPARLTDVSVESGGEGPTVRIKTSGTVKYEASLIDSPTRLLIDFSDTVYAWSKTPVASDLAPIREIRGSQFRKGVARVVVEMTRPMGYRIDQGPDGLVVAIEPATGKSARPVPAVAQPKRQEPPVVVADGKPIERVADPAKAPAPPAAAPTAMAEPMRPVRPEAPPVVVRAQAPSAPAPPVVVRAQAPSAPAPPVVVRAQAPSAPAPPVVVRAAAPRAPAPPVVVRAQAPSTPAPPVVVRAQAPSTPAPPVVVRTQAPSTPAPPVVVDAQLPSTPVPSVVARAQAPSAPATAVAEPPAAAEPSVPAPLASPFVGQARPGAPGAQAPVANGSKLISLDFKDAEVLNLLRILAAESGRNIVAGEDVRGKVSVSLRNVTWEQALDTILEVRGLAKIDKGNVIRIVSLDQLTKEREAQARVEDARRRAEIETRTKLAEAELKETELASRRAASEAAIDEARKRGPLKEETIRLSYADPEEIARTLQGILGIPPEGAVPVATTLLVPQVLPSGPSPSTPTGGGQPYIAEQPFSQAFGPQAGQPRQASVSVSQDVLAKGITVRAHKPTNSLFVRHYEADLERIKKLVREQLDVPLPQVKIEARMEILDRNALEAIGIQWGGATAKQVGSTTVVGQGFQSSPGKIPGQVLPALGGVLLPDGTTVLLDPAGPTSGGPFNIPLGGLFGVDRTTGLPTGGNLVNLPFQLLPNAASQIPAAGIAFGIIGTNFNINLALQALASQGKTRTLARPEIVTVENNKATVSLGEEIPYATVSSAGTQIQFKEALLKLDVTPTVIRERVAGQDVRKIKLVVVVENNSRGDIVNLGSGGTPPAINRRKAETQVLIKEGDRLVIGGVTQSTTSNTVRKVPLMGDIPIIGWLFKQRETFESGRELVVFVTPSLLITDGDVAAR